jgi:hypothetical protein
MNWSWTQRPKPRKNRTKSPRTQKKTFRLFTRAVFFFSSLDPRGFVAISSLAPDIYKSPNGINIPGGNKVVDKRRLLEKMKKTLVVSFCLTVFAVIIMSISFPGLFYFGVVPFNQIAFFMLPLVMVWLISKLLEYAEEEYIVVMETRTMIERRLYLSVIAGYVFPIAVKLLIGLTAGGLILKIPAIACLAFIAPLVLIFLLFTLKSVGTVSGELYKIFSKTFLEEFSWLKTADKKFNQ